MKWQEATEPRLLLASYCPQVPTTLVFILLARRNVESPLFRERIGLGMEGVRVQSVRTPFYASSSFFLRNVLHSASDSHTMFRRHRLEMRISRPEERVCSL
jgi:hypothetical protein